MGMIEIEKGWLFSSADFSVQSSGQRGALGNVMLIRTPKQKNLWHKIINGLDDDNTWPDLYARGKGMTIEEAIADANKNAKEIGLLEWRLVN